MSDTRSRLMMSETTTSISIGSFDLRAHRVRDYRTADDIERERRAAAAPVPRRWTESIWIEPMMFFVLVVLLIVGLPVFILSGSLFASPETASTSVDALWSTGGDTEFGSR